MIKLAFSANDKYYRAHQTDSLMLCSIYINAKKINGEYKLCVSYCVCINFVSYKDRSPQKQKTVVEIYFAKNYQNVS